MQEEEWAQERLEDAMYREYMKEKEVRQLVSERSCKDERFCTTRADSVT